MTTEATKPAPPLGQWNIGFTDLSRVKARTPDVAGVNWESVKHFDLLDGVDTAAKAAKCRPTDWRVWVNHNRQEMTAACRFAHPKLKTPAGFTPLFGLTTANHNRERLRYFAGLVEDSTGRFLVAAREHGRKYETGFDPLGVGRAAVDWWKGTLDSPVGDAFAGMEDSKMDDRKLAELLVDASRVWATGTRKAPLFPRRAIPIALDLWGRVPTRRRTVLEACLMQSTEAAKGSAVVMWDRAFLFAGLASTTTIEAARVF